jgi:hypothetical protein
MEIKSDEVFLPIKGFEEFGKISNYGNVIRYSRWVNNGTNQRFIPEKLLKVHTSKDLYGYRSVTICENSKRLSLNLARTVYETFNNVMLNNKFCIVHADGDKSNCRLDNLKVITRRDKQNSLPNTTGFTGVSSRGDNQYTATIVFEGKRLTVHSSDSKEDCMKIYELAKSLINQYEKEKVRILQNSKLHNKIIQKLNRLK